MKDSDGIIWYPPEMQEDGKYAVFATDSEHRAKIGYQLEQFSDVVTVQNTVMTPELMKACARACNVNNESRRLACKEQLLRWLILNPAAL